MKTITKFWQSVKRNPVINGFIIAVATQALQDYYTNQIDWVHLWGYLSALLIGVAVRQFTVPVKDNEKLKENVSKAIVRLEADFQKRLSERLDHLDGGGK